MLIPVGRPNIPNLSEIASEVDEIMRTGQVTNGKYVKMLEQKVCDILKVDNAIAVANCTTGLMMLARYALPRGGRISVPDFTWASTKMAVEYTIRELELEEVNIDTFLIESIYHKSNGAIAVDAFGNRCDIKTDKPIIYDAAHSMGTKGVGNRGIAEVFSMSPMKTFTAIEGGIITTNHKDLALKLREERKYFGRMPEINALIGIYNLNNLDWLLENKKTVFNSYKILLEPFGFRFQKITDSNYNEICVVHEDAKAIRDKIKDKMEIRQRFEPTSRWFNSNYIYNHSFILPSWLGVPVNDVVDIIKEAFK